MLYQNVRIGANLNATQRLGARSSPHAQQPPKISLPFKKAEGGAGEAAKKLKGTGVGLLRLTIFRKVFIKPLSGVRA
tara:strand:- start:2506 stop:2736 length:231 start_codon:yes stop_codon:yes gene_type:complete